MKIFDLILSDLFGVNRAAVIEAKAAPVLVPLEAAGAGALSSAVNTAITHNTGYAIQEMSKGFDAIGLTGMTRTLVESVVAGGLEHITADITPETASAPFNLPGGALS